MGKSRVLASRAGRATFATCEEQFPGQGWEGKGSRCGHSTSLSSPPPSPDPIDRRRLLSSEPQARLLSAPFHLRLDKFQGRSGADSNGPQSELCSHGVGGHLGGGDGGWGHSGVKCLRPSPPCLAPPRCPSLLGASLQSYPPSTPGGPGGSIIQNWRLRLGRGEGHVQGHRISDL